MPIRPNTLSPGEFIRNHLVEIGGVDYVQNIYTAYKNYLTGFGIGINRWTMTYYLWLCRKLNLVVFDHASPVEYWDAMPNALQPAPNYRPEPRPLAPSPRHYYRILDAADPHWINLQKSYRVQMGFGEPTTVRTQPKVVPEIPELPAPTAAVPAKKKVAEKPVEEKPGKATPTLEDGDIITPKKAWENIAPGTLLKYDEKNRALIPVDEDGEPVKIADAQGKLIDRVAIPAGWGKARLLQNFNKRALKKKPRREAKPRPPKPVSAEMQGFEKEISAVAAKVDQLGKTPTPALEAEIERDTFSIADKVVTASEGATGARLEALQTLATRLRSALDYVGLMKSSVTRLQTAGSGARAEQARRAFADALKVFREALTMEIGK
jgi:hypothetical protein